MNYKKLSELAHVSVSTVSKAFSGSEDISSDTREHVFAVAKEHGCFEKYYKSKYARKVIAVICPEFYSKYYAAFCEALQAKLLGLDAIAILSSTNFDPNIEKQLIEFYTAYAKVDGVILVGGSAEISSQNTIPMVSVGKRKNIDSVVNDSNDALNDAISALIDLGHKDIGFIGESLTTLKEANVINVLKQNNLTVIDKYFFRSKLRFQDAGEDGAHYFMSLDKMPTAIIAAYDQIAFGAINTFIKNGYNIPEDVSIIGKDNIDDCEKSVVKLSSIASLTDEVADIAIKLLFERIENEFLPVREINSPARFIQRESVTKAKKG